MESNNTPHMYIKISQKNFSIYILKILHLRI